MASGTPDQVPNDTYPYQSVTEVCGERTMDVVTHVLSSRWSKTSGRIATIGMYLDGGSSPEAYWIIDVRMYPTLLGVDFHQT